MWYLFFSKHSLFEDVGCGEEEDVVGEGRVVWWGEEWRVGTV